MLLQHTSIKLYKVLQTITGSFFQQAAPPIAMLKTKSEPSKPIWASSALPPYRRKPLVEVPKPLARRPATPAVSSVTERLIQSSSEAGQVRPLSGRIFIRRTIRNGWVAKAFDTPGSRVSLGEVEPCESLESFFEDDLNKDTQEEGLNKLLHCNTLNAEPKKTCNQKDWVPGKVDIPALNCQRCRDHWYGLSSVSCDEHPASNMIIVGQSHKEEGDLKPVVKQVIVLQSKRNKMQNQVSSNTPTAPRAMAETNSKATPQKEKHPRNRHIQFVIPSATEEKSPKRKRITFDLNINDGPGSSCSSRDLIDQVEIRTDDNDDNDEEDSNEGQVATRKYSTNAANLSSDSDPDSGGSSILINSSTSEAQETEQSIGEKEKKIRRRKKDGQADRGDNRRARLDRRESRRIGLHLSGRGRELRERTDPFSGKESNISHHEEREVETRVRGRVKWGSSPKTKQRQATREEKVVMRGRKEGKGPLSSSKADSRNNLHRYSQNKVGRGGGEQRRGKGTRESQHGDGHKTASSLSQLEDLSHAQCNTAGSSCNSLTSNCSQHQAHCTEDTSTGATSSFFLPPLIAKSQGELPNFGRELSRAFTFSYFRLPAQL